MSYEFDPDEPHTLFNWDTLPKEMSEYLDAVAKHVGEHPEHLPIAMAAAAYEAAMAVAATQGGASSEQESSALFEFVRRVKPSRGPIRMVRYDELLEPDTGLAPMEMPYHAMRWLQTEAANLLDAIDDEVEDNEPRIDHLLALLRGELPAGWVITQADQDHDEVESARKVSPLISIEDEYDEIPESEVPA